MLAVIHGVSPKLQTTLETTVACCSCIRGCMWVAFVLTVDAGAVK